MNKNYQIYYLAREKSQGGGLAIGISKELESTLVREGNDQIEALVVQITVEKFPIRIVTAYGPQENETKEKKEEFWNFLEEEATKAAPEATTEATIDYGTESSTAATIHLRCSIDPIYIFYFRIPIKYQ